MAVPKSKNSKARGRNRRANNFKLVVPSIVECPQCHKKRMAHHACKFCGYYDGRQVMQVEAEQ
ncbi:MAG: 50S ribosomal protein L32 [Christensenellales bacterium]|jgi:large subunit ribosomal protein L32